MQPSSHPGQKAPATPYHIVVTAPYGARKVVEVEERDVAVPLIGLALRGVYQLGNLIYAGPEYGTQMEARLSYEWRGAARDLVGAVVPVDFNAPKIIVPLGFFGRAH